jgi:hypothetical protein
VGGDHLNDPANELEAFARLYQMMRKNSGGFVRVATASSLFQMAD